MHPFAELIGRSTTFTLGTIKETEERVSEALQISSATPLVKALQSLRLQRVIMAVGMFSIFEANLQDILGGKDGFEEARKVLLRENERGLEKCFVQLIAAINVLKHGRGRSYDSLLLEIDSLPFRVKKPGENCFSEGDVSEVCTWIDVDDCFVQRCASVIQDVSEVLDRVH
jgi:hypothetical protein